MKTTAIVLAGGRGKRMNSAVPKQFLMIQDKPVLYYSLKAFEDSFIDSIILVASEDDKEYCQKELNTLWDETRRLVNPHKIYVDLSDKLYKIKTELLNKNEKI